MHIFVGANVRDLRHAKRWITQAPGVRETLLDLRTWAESKKKNWGDSTLFLEFSCRRYPGERGSQIDLLLAFSDRSAVCEVKDKPFSDLVIADHADQVDRQATLIEARLRDRGRITSLRKPAALLFLPRLNMSELRKVNQTLNAEGVAHIRAAG